METNLVLKKELGTFDTIVETAIAALDGAKNFIVTDKTTAVQAQQMGVELKDIEKKAEKIRKEIVKPYNDHVSEINKYAKEILKPVAEAKRIIGDKAATWQKAENERIAEKNRKAEEKEREKAKDTGMPAAPTAPQEKESVVQTMTVWKYEITDESLIPREYLQVDKGAIQKAVKSGGVRNIPGVRIYDEQVPVLK
jgi:hypothetical protein